MSDADLSPRDVRRNFACLVWMGSVFAMGWAEVMVVLQPLLVHYGATNTQIGIVQGVLIASLPGMLVSPWITRRFRRKKIYMFVADALYLLPLGVVGAVVWAGGIGSHGTMVGFIVVMMLLGQIAAGFGGLPHQEFFTACIPMRLRGRLAGVSAGLGGALGMAAAGIAAWVLGVMPVPQGFGALLVLAWFLCQLANTSPLFAKEPPTPVEKSPPPWGREMWRAFFADKQFLRVAVVICLASPLIGQLAVFSSVFAFRELDFEPKMAAKLALAASVCRLALSPVAGWFTDAFGARRALTFWTAFAGSGFVLLYLFPCKTSVFAAAGIAAVAGSGFSGAMNALTSGIPRPENRAGHFTLLGFCMITANSAGPLMVGWMFDQVDYRTGFGVMAVMVLVLTGGAVRLLRGLSTRHEDFV